MNERLKRFILKTWKYVLTVMLILIGFLIYNYSNIFVVSDFKIFSLNNTSFQNITPNEITSKEYFQTNEKYFKLDTQKLKDEILASSPFIKSVYISKEFPNSLYVYIEERFPFITLEIDTKKCILLDDIGFVLEISEAQCKDSTQKYKTIEVKSDNPKVIFTQNTKSNYFQIKKLVDIVKVMNEYSVPVVSMSITENVVTIISTKQKQYIFSFNQDIETQLARFVAVLGQLEKKNYSYKKIDFRFKRPVLTIK